MHCAQASRDLTTLSLDVQLPAGSACKSCRSWLLHADDLGAANPPAMPDLVSPIEKPCALLPSGRAAELPLNPFSYMVTEFTGCTPKALGRGASAV